MNQATTKLNWDCDVAKHFVRRQAWLPAALAQAEASRKAGREPSYLTFCAAQAIDVFLFLREGLLSRDQESDVVLNTFYCERDEVDFNIISQQIGAHDQGFLGDFQDIVLFEDDVETSQVDDEDTFQWRPPELRRRLDTRERHRRLRRAAPFDVLNLDICGTFFPPKSGVLSPMLQSMRRILDWQTDCAQEEESFSSFTLFLTAHVECGRINDAAMSELVNMVTANRKTYTGFSKALEIRFGLDDPDAIATEDFTGFYCLALPKVIVSEAFKRGWLVRTRFAGLHRRARSHNAGATSSAYSILSWVGRFDLCVSKEQSLGLQHAAEYAEIISELASEPRNVDDDSRKVHGETKANLEEIVSFRESHLGKIESRE